MIGWLKGAWDQFRGAGSAAVTVPPMDGALRPNQLLEAATALVNMPAPDNLVPWRDGVAFTSATDVYHLNLASGQQGAVFTAAGPISALAATPDGRLVVGLATGGIQIVDDAGPGEVTGRDALHCPTAIAADGNGRLLVANGSSRHGPGKWKHDLMSLGASGSIVALDTRGQSTTLVGGLAWPYGLTIDASGNLIVTESWRHRILRLRDGRARDDLLHDLPGYPARIAPAKDGWWLAVFAPRTQLIEFVLREPRFRAQMMDEVAPEYWVAPSMQASSTFLEPLQGGAQKHLGVLKPWSPTQSYGLVVRLDAQFHPMFSHHSRADGQRHGVTSVLEVDGRVLAATHGGNAIVELEK